MTDSQPSAELPREIWACQMLRDDGTGSGYGDWSTRVDRPRPEECRYLLAKAVAPLMEAVEAWTKMGSHPRGVCDGMQWHRCKQHYETAILVAYRALSEKPEAAADQGGEG